VERRHALLLMTRTTGTERARYEHRQSGTLMRVSIALAVLLIAALAELDPAIEPALLIAVPVLAVILIVFDGLTIRVTADTLSWRFGHIGFPRGSVPLAEIAAVTVTRTTFWEGWGIRRTRRGWLFSVSGFDAVLVRRRNGSTFLLGTDEPRRLKSVLDAAMSR
jgi:hypothetical protein